MKLRLTVEVPQVGSSTHGTERSQRALEELTQAAIEKTGIVVLTSMLFTTELDLLNVEVIDEDDGIQQ